MDQLGEYHDPDYPEAAVCVKEEPPSLSEDDKVEKIKTIIRREFTQELETREAEVRLIDQRMSSARRLLHRLRYSIVNKYYTDQKLLLNPAQIQDEIAAQRDPRAKAEISSILRDGQQQIHPSVKRLLGKSTVDIDEIFRTRGPRNKTRKNYSAMLQKRNYTISADATMSLRPDDEPSASTSTSTSASTNASASTSTSANASVPRKLPRRLQPRPTNVVTLDEATRNQMKHRYRFIIGNTSKYVPAASRADRSTHKWLLYVRGARDPDPSPLLTSVQLTLHHSYAPHHRVTLHKHPFHVSRRGWGEFPAKIELHFTMPERNRPAIVEHNIKLDRNYTGMQTLGSETIVDVWLYSTPEMLKYEYKEDEHTLTDIQTNQPTNTEEAKVKEEETQDWMDFFKTPTELDVDEMFIKPSKDIKQEIDLKSEIDFEEKIDAEKTEIVPTEILNQPTSTKKRIVKYINPTTGKVFYLEMDRGLDLSKVQEIIINNKTTKVSPVKTNGVKKAKKGVSLLKPEVKSQLKTESTIRNDRAKQNFPHLENDHCYLYNPRVEDIEVKKEDNLYDRLVSIMPRFSDVRSAVNYLVRKIPLISDEARDPDFARHFPFVVESSERYWKLDYAKRRNIEWSRAKLINRLITDHFGPKWRTKQILIYIRLHGHYPVRTEIAKSETWSTFDNEPTIKDLYPDPSNITSLSIFKHDDSSTENAELTDDEDIDVVNETVKVTVKREVTDTSSLEVMAVDGSDDRLRFMYVERKCADIGIELRNEDIGSGYSYSAVHAVLLSAMKCFAEEMIRSGLAAKRRQDNPQAVPSIWTGMSSSRTRLALPATYAGTRSSRLRLLTGADLAARPDSYTPL